MNLDDLLHAHQLAAMNVASTRDDDLYGKIAEYADRIRQLRTGPKRVANTLSPTPPTVIYGSYAADPADESENPDRGRADP